YNDVDETMLKMSQDVSNDGEREVFSWFGKSAGGGVLKDARLTAQRNDAPIVDPTLAAPFLSGTAGAGAYHHVGATTTENHDRQYLTVSLTCDKPLDWIAFGVWLSMMLHRYGPQILR